MALMSVPPLLRGNARAIRLTRMSPKDINDVKAMHGKKQTVESDLKFKIPHYVIVGADMVKEEHYQINGNIDLFRNLHEKIGNEVIFSELPKNKLIQD